MERSHRLKVPCNVFPKEDWIAGDEILAILQEYRIDFIVLAGFLVRVPDLLLHAYPGKIINIHPALLPKFGGKETLEPVSLDMLLMSDTYLKLNTLY